jgi:DNA invertase Pin-like site-specific DNA recombinase
MTGFLSPQRIGYMRVSTPEQRSDRQIDGLKDLCDQLYLEHVSAVADRRPAFDDALAALNSGDMLIVWDLDRAFRSTLDAIMTADALRARGVSLKIVKLNIDTTTPEGELFYTMLAAFAQYERRILSRRTREGLHAARKRGAKIGRPRALADETISDAHSYIAETGYPQPYVAALLDVSPVTLSRGFKRLGLASTKSPPGLSGLSSQLKTMRHSQQQERRAT